MRTQMQIIKRLAAELCIQIEKLPASEEQTALSTQANNLLTAIPEQYTGEPLNMAEVESIFGQ